MNLEDKAQLNYYPVEIESSTSSTEPSYNTSSEAVSDSNIQTTGGTSIMSAGAFQSPNYVKGSSGWKIDVLGNVEFSNGYFRGDITGASGTFTGTVTATSGLIGGFSIGSDYIKDVADSFGLASTVTGSNDVRFWAGDTFANRATADLRIYEDGAIIASNIEATGSIFATSGWIGSATALVYESQGINTGTTGWIRGGQTGYNTGTGYFLGYYSGNYVFSIGDTTTGNSLLWDGSSLIVNGSSVANNDIYGDGSDGDVTISTNTTITADMYYNNLTINDGIILNTGSYRIFVKETLTFLGTGKIARDGNSGGNGTSAVDGGAGGAGGTAGAALSSGSLFGSYAGKAGGVGATGGIPSCNVNGGNGVAGENTDKSIGSAGVGGGAGNNGGTSTNCTSGSSSSGGTISGTVYNTVKNSTHALMMADFQGGTLTILKPSSGSGSGGGGGAGKNADNNAFGSGGGGGGSGSGGGIITIFARKIVTVNSNVFVQANGGNGGNGGNGSPSTGAGTQQRYGGGGGGGGGGNGGIIILVYGTKTGTGTTSVTGGTGGTAGSNGNGTPASNGTDGADGTLIQLVV